MRCYRICDRRFAADLSGAGARRFGGRWNPKGVALLYTANSSALAAMEMLVGIDWDLAPELALVEIELPDEPIERIAPQGLPHDWSSPTCLELRSIGAAWVAGQAGLVLQVPSAALPTAPDAFNFLVNPSHPDFSRVRMLNDHPFFFDPRLAGKVQSL